MPPLDPAAALAGTRLQVLRRSESAVQCLDRAMREDRQPDPHPCLELPEEAPMSESTTVNVAEQAAPASLWDQAHSVG